MIKAKKSLGQNFLVDRRVAERIVKAVAPNATDVIIEIGPGTGALTKLLLARAGAVVAIEIDKGLAAALRSSIVEKKFSLLQMDALEVDWAELIRQGSKAALSPQADQTDQRRVRVVANLPYYISTAIISRLLTAGNEPGSPALYDLTLMLQKEVAERITSAPWGREYGYLSVLVQFYSEATRLFDVPPSAFEPEPKVESAVVRLKVRKERIAEVDDEAGFLLLVRASFAQRRKTIMNNLKAAAKSLGISDAEGIFNRACIDARRRAETLTIQEFAALYAATRFQDKANMGQRKLSKGGNTR